MSYTHHTLTALTWCCIFDIIFSFTFYQFIDLYFIHCIFYYLAEVYDKKSNIIYSLKQLKSQSVTLSASNLEDRETLVGSADGRRPATIIYTSGSTGTPKGNEIFNRLRAASRTNFDISRLSAFKMY